MDEFLLVSYDTSTFDEPGLVISEIKQGKSQSIISYDTNTYIVRKMVIGEQAKIIYRLLTEQSLKGKIVEDER